jgi:aldehyde dehydrogenase (NAD+)
MTTTTLTHTPQDSGVPVSARDFSAGERVVIVTGAAQGIGRELNGTGREVGDTLSRHPGVDMISFTGSTAAGKQVGAAAGTVKRVCLELGGKSVNIVLPDADLEQAARWNIQRCFFSARQSCHAPSRMLVHESQVEGVVPFLVDEARRYRLGDPLESSTTIGPVVSAAQFKTVTEHIQSGLDEGARLVVSGVGRADDLDRGYFVRPTVFNGVTPDIRIAREEIFGPVLAVLSYRDEDDALRIANDSPYGLGGYVFGGHRENARRVVNGLRAGRISYKARPRIPTRPRGDTSSPASAARWAGSGSKNTSKSNPCTDSRTKRKHCRFCSAETLQVEQEH